MMCPAPPPRPGSFATLPASAFAAVWALLLCLLAGCASPTTGTAPRAFEFPRDAFAFTNELRWVYRKDPKTGQLTHAPRTPAPRYSLRCFAMAKGARQFLWHARFDPSLPQATDEVYRRLVREVVGRSPRVPSSEASHVVIPGFASLSELSAARTAAVKDACGGPLESFTQRGHWRMVLPFFPGPAARAAARFASDIRHQRYPVVHLVRFPELTMNHAVLLYGVEDDNEDLRFLAYDPNCAAVPMKLDFDRGRRTFILEPSDYFPGGPVDVYEVYRGPCY